MLLPIEAKIVATFAFSGDTASPGLGVSLRRGVAVSLVVHAIVAVVGWATIEPAKRTELIDIELAPPPPPVEALIAEKKQIADEDVGKQQETEQAAQEPTKPDEEGYASDAGVPDAYVADAAVDAAPVDARPRRRPDAAIDAGEPMVATVEDGGVEDGGVDDGGVEVAIDDGGPPGDGGGDVIAEGTGDAGIVANDEGSGSGAGSGKPGMADEAGVDGAPSTAGTSSNLLAYFPNKHQVTVLIRFDRLRGTEWLDPTERLFQPMPDYKRLFGGSNAKIGQRLEMLVISTPEPASAIATTLVAKTKLDRASLRNFLGGAGPITWSTAKGGLVGKRGGPNVNSHDKRVFLSPFRGWFLLAHPLDVGGALAPAGGNQDTIEATVRLPGWLAGIRKIEEESGLDARGPALVLTMDLGGKRIALGDGNDFGLGVKSFPMPQRITAAAEVVKQGWLVRGNMKFASAADAAEFEKTALAVKQRIADSTALQLAVGKPISRIVANLSFARGADRVSYATSVSISDMQAVMAVATQLLDAHFANK